MGALISSYTAESVSGVCDALISSALPVTGAYEERVSRNPRISKVMNFMSKYLPKAPLTRPAKTEDLSANEEVIKRWLQDPLTYKGKILARTATEFSFGKNYVSGHASDIKVPVLFVHGINDPLAYIKGSENALRDAQTEDKTLLKYEARHDVIFEPAVMDKVRDDITKFVNSHISKK